GSVTPSQGSCAGGPSFTCALGTIPASGVATITASYTVPSSTTGAQTNTATVSSGVSDPNAGNNTASDTDTVSTSADLSITKTDGESSVTAGDGLTYTYTITVTNNGPSAATRVVADVWPAGFPQGSVTPSQGSCGPGPSFTCSLGNVP